MSTLRNGGEPTRRTLALARGLGTFGIGLGLLELLLPGTLARLAGVRASRGSVRVCGAREIVTGIGILEAGDPTPWVWGRVAGAAVDLAMLGPQLRARNPHRGRAALAFGAVATVTLLDVLSARQLSCDDSQALHYDYSDRSGLPRPPEEMRGAWRSDAEAASERPPPALHPFPTSDSMH
jgi:hypothetical protein